MFRQIMAGGIFMYDFTNNNLFETTVNPSAAAEAYKYALRESIFAAVVANTSARRRMTEEDIKDLKAAAEAAVGTTKIKTRETGERSFEKVIVFDERSMRYGKALITILEYVQSNLISFDRFDANANVIYFQKSGDSSLWEMKLYYSREDEYTD